MKYTLNIKDSNSLPPHGDPAKFSDEKRRILDDKLKNLFGEYYGPKPISIEEYKKKNGPLNYNSTDVPVKKLRGGIAARTRREVGELKRLVRVAVTAEEKLYFVRKIQEIRRQEKNRIIEKNKSKDPKMDELFKKLFELGNKFN